MFKVGDVGYTYDRFYGLIKLKILEINTYDKYRYPKEVDYCICEHYETKIKVNLDELFKTQREVIQHNYEKWSKQTNLIEDKINTPEDLINFMYSLIPKDDHTILETEVIKSKAKELLNIDIKGE